MSYQLDFSACMKVYAPLSVVVDRTWRYVTGGTTPWDLPRSVFWKSYPASPTEMLDSELLATSTTGPAAKGLVDGTVLGSVVPVLIGLLGLLMCMSSILVLVERMDKVQGRNPALRLKAWLNSLLKALRAAVIIAGDILNLNGSLVVQSMTGEAHSQLVRLRKTTGYKWTLRVFFVLTAAAILVTITPLALIPVLAVVPVVQTVYSSTGLLLRPVIYVARLVFAWRHIFVGSFVYIVRLVVAHYPTVFWFAVSGARRLFALAKFSGSLVSTLLFRQ